MKYKEQYLFSYIDKLNTLQECDSITEWIKTLHASPLQLEERLELIEEKRKIITKRLKIEEFINSKGNTNIERLKDFPQLIDLLERIFDAGYYIGENDVYSKMNLKEPNNIFGYNFKSYMESAWDIKDDVLELLYKEEINKL